MIVDHFMFNKEFDTLRCRLYQTRGIVDRTIVIEANLTMSGSPKPYHLTENRAEFPELEIVTVDLTDLAGIPSQIDRPWVTEHTNVMWKRDYKQRNAAKHLLDALDPDDILIHGDPDEIPRRHIIEGFDGPNWEIRGLISVMVMRRLIYSTKVARSVADWSGPVIGRKHSLDAAGLSPALMRIFRWSQEPIPDAGWHMNWFGGKEARKQKALDFAHGELASKAHQIGYDYPAQRLAPDGVTVLGEYHGELPDWVTDGHAPESWMETYW